VLNWILRHFGTALANYLDKPAGRYVSFSVAPLGALRATLRPGDVLLVEGDKPYSVAIKYLTQSTWSHAAFYVGDALGPAPDGGEPNDLIEADLTSGVIAVPLSLYRSSNTRICRPVGLTDADRENVVSFMVESIGLQYDLKNIIDLMRYLLPMPPVPTTVRRRMLALGSGDPTRAICSSLIAQAFQSVRYPILPHIRRRSVYDSRRARHVVRELLHIRHHSLFTPRDFDLSPYFQVVKPTLDGEFAYKRLTWYEDPPENEPSREEAAE
jgi:hypothetical protein